MTLRSLISTCIVVFAATSIATATTKQFNVESTPAPATYGKSLRLEVNKIDYRRDLTRIYGSLQAMPNTAHRIDAVTIDGVSCTDIDGIDLERYFQTEEDGRIDLEIDFPPMKRRTTHTVTLTTVHGKTSFTIKPVGK